MIEAVEIPTSDGIMLRGQTRVAGGEWIVLVHALGYDLDMWGALFDEFDDSLSLLAADLRGHGGSDGVCEDGFVEADVEALLSYVRRQGAGMLVAICAGEGASVVLESAARARADAVVLLGPSGEFSAIPNIPRFIIAASEDPKQAAAAEALQQAPGWSLVANLPVAEASAELLTGPWGTNVCAYITSFIRDVRLHHPRGS